MKAPVRFLASAALAALPLAAAAQSGGSYQPPLLVKQGSRSGAVPGAGRVTVQVLVKADGTVHAVKVLKSTNPADDAVALEIVRHSVYRSATRGGKPVDAYFDFPLDFAGGGIAVGGPETTGPTAAAFAAIEAGKYDRAKSELTAYLQTHHEDREGNTLLGVADAFAGDAGGAAAAFDAAGTIPEQYRALAAQSYANDAISLADRQQNAAAVAAAGRAIDVLPNDYNGYYVQGVAYANEGQFVPAIAVLEKAHTLARSAKVDDKRLAAIEFNLMIAQLGAGDIAAGKATSRDVVRRDPSMERRVGDTADVLINNGAVTLANTGKGSAAIARLEAGATAFPLDAGNLYAQAATIMATAKAPDWKNVEAEANRAIAADTDNGRANYIAGVAAARTNDTKGALAYMNKAKASPQYGRDAAFAKQVDAALKTLVEGASVGP